MPISEGAEPTNSKRESSFGEVLEGRFQRRSLLGGLAKMIPAAAFASSIKSATAETPVASEPTRAARDYRIQFTAVEPSTSDFIVVAQGYRVGILIKWGDGLFSDSPAFQPENQTAAAQAKQFGYNNDWMGYFALPAHDVASPRSGLLAVNHEYTNAELMFKNWAGVENQTREQSEIEMEAHGLTVVEIARDNNGNWHYIPGSRYNRRVSVTTMFDVTGPAAGSDWLKTSADPTGMRVMGTLNNCSGGQTPWGTILSGEENFQGYFANRGALPDGPVKTSHTRYGLPNASADYAWYRHFDRFDLTKEPNEPFRFGWVVEFDPYDPTSVPKKRTALGRVRHEACTIEIARDGRIAAYSGDDQVFEFVYKFVSNGRFNPFDRRANDSLLDDGTLYAARFNADGSGEWLPLVFGRGALTAQNGFNSQADVLVNTRLAATAVGATRMDRPEDIETNPVTGRVYIALTNNSSRTDRDVDRANPRASNRWGHIIELTETDSDYAAETFRWEIFMLCGDPAQPAQRTFFAGYDPRQVSAIAAPDNITFDSKGNLWIATDGQPGILGINDGIYAVPTEGPERGFNRRLLSSVRGAEMSSLLFNPDDTALFVGVQHPGEGGRWTDDPLEAVSSFPDRRSPARPTVLVVTKAEGSPVVGS